MFWRYEKVGRRRKEQMRRARARKVLFETLEDRHLLAITFVNLSGGDLDIYDWYESGLGTAKDVDNSLKLSRDGTTITIEDPTNKLTTITTDRVTQVSDQKVTVLVSDLTGTLHLELERLGSLTFSSGTIAAKGGITAVVVSSWVPTRRSAPAPPRAIW